LNFVLTLYAIGNQDTAQIIFLIDFQHKNKTTLLGWFCSFIYGRVGIVSILPSNQPSFWGARLGMLEFLTTN
jgi:hypothetical protein